MTIYEINLSQYDNYALLWMAFIFAIFLASLLATRKENREMQKSNNKTSSCKNVSVFIVLTSSVLIMIALYKITDFVGFINLISLVKNGKTLVTEGNVNYVKQISKKHIKVEINSMEFDIYKSFNQCYDLDKGARYINENSVLRVFYVEKHGTKCILKVDNISKAPS